MSPDDPRHGTTYGWKLHRIDDEEACADCKAAVAAYQMRRSNDAYLGKPHSLPRQGFIRRIQALQAIGWSLNDLGAHIGLHPSNLPRAVAQGAYVTRRVYDAAVATYEALSMTVPDDRFANRRRLIAAKKGYAPPLAWDDIDNDLEPIIVERIPHTRDEHVDQVAIDRALAGDKTVTLTVQEKNAATEQWTRAGGSLAELNRLTGWNSGRYVNRDAA